jgi:chromosome segregation protein
VTAAVTLATRIKELEKEVETALGKNEELNTARKSVEEQLTKAKEEGLAAGKRAEEYQEKVGKLEEELKATQSQLDQYLRVVGEETDLAPPRFENDLELEQKQLEIDDKNRQLNLQETTIKELREELLKLRQTKPISLLELEQKEVSEPKKKVQPLPDRSEEMTRLQQRIEELERKLSEVQLENAELAEHQQRERTEATRRISTLRSDLTQEKQEIQALTGEAERKSKNANRERMRLTKTEKQAANLQQLNQELGEYVEESENLLSKKQEKIEELQKTIEEQQNRISNLETAVQLLPDLQKELADERERVQAFGRVFAEIAQEYPVRMEECLRKQGLLNDAGSNDIT